MNIRTVFTICLSCLVSVKVVDSQPEDCAILQNIISNCSCEGAVTNPDDIVINCRHKGLTSVPTINGTYNGTIFEFTLASNNIQVLKEDAFQGLSIERLDFTDNKLRNISNFTFRGLEDTLIILKISGDLGSNVPAPFKALSNLTNLKELTLREFTAPNNNLEEQSDFQPFSHLTLLWLDNWNLRAIGADVFTGLTSLATLRLTKHKLLVSYPVQAVNNLKNTLTELEISNTAITELTFLGFQELKLLKSLKLKSNNITLLEEQSFGGLDTALEYLDLSYNKVASQLGRLKVLQGLKTLALQNVGITSLTNSDFLQNKTELMELNLAYNNLINIEDNTFTNLPSLKTLDLSFNQIFQMATNALSGLNSLEILALDQQKLVAGGRLTLPFLPQLTSLDLTSTHISNSSWDKIRQTATLTILKMSGSIPDGYLPDLVFQNLNNLQHLDLSSNQIKNIGEGTFVGPTATLKTIYLHANDIEYFDQCTFYNYSFPITIDLSSNPLHCDCTLYWLRKAYEENTIKLSSLEECAYPPTLNKTRFISNSPSGFCLDPSPAPKCVDYYIPTTTTPQTTSTIPSTTPVPVNITVSFVSATVTSITVSWRIDIPGELEAIVVYYSRLQSSDTPIQSRDLPPSNDQYKVNGLQSNTAYEVCVNGRRKSGGTIHRCVNHRTKPSTLVTTTMQPSGPGGLSQSTEIGIIVGAVIGGLILFSILVAIIYLIFVRKKTTKEKYPVQPRTFTPAELPSIGYDSKRYRKKKKSEKTDGNSNNVTVTVISDGQTTQPQVGRVSTGSYQYLNNGNQVSDEPMPSTSYTNDPPAQAMAAPYENDMTLRPLPQMPGGEGYDNVGFSHSTVEPQEPHTYSEIKL